MFTFEIKTKRSSYKVAFQLFHSVKFVTYYTLQVTNSLKS